MSAVTALADTGVPHGPELPHHGDVYEGRVARRAVKTCECGAVDTGLPHAWHDLDCPKHQWVGYLIPGTTRVV